MADWSGGEAFYAANATALARGTHTGKVHLSAAAAAALADAVWRAVPREACGVLGGTASDDGCAIRAVAPLANLATAPDRFTADPIAFVAAIAALAHAGERFLGFFHSHPRGTTSPSAVDRRELWRACLHLIAAPAADGTLAVAAYLVDSRGHFAPMPVVARAATDAAP